MDSGFSVYGSTIANVSTTSATAGSSEGGRSGSRKHGDRQTPGQGRCQWARCDELEWCSCEPEGPVGHFWDDPPHDASPRHKI